MLLLNPMKQPRLTRHEGDHGGVGRLCGHGALDGGEGRGHVVHAGAAPAAAVTLLLASPSARAGVVSPGLMVMLLLLLPGPHLECVVAARLVAEVGRGRHGRDVAVVYGECLSVSLVYAQVDGT